MRGRRWLKGEGIPSRGQKIKYWWMKLLRKNPIWRWEAEEWGEYVPGIGVYMSDGVYFDLGTYVIINGFTPMWEDGEP